MIEFQYVEKRYPSKGIALYINSLKINSGEIVGILGANGSGKTTLLKAIMGLGELHSGQILIDGSPIETQYEHIAFITEEGSFLPDLTPAQYADFLADFFPRFNLERYNSLLDYFELERNRRIKTFSKGQKSKLEMCAGIAKQAKYILMDEPFLGVDMLTRRDFLKLMISSLNGDETLLISTHIVSEIEHVIERAIFLRDGRIAGDYMIDDMRLEGLTVEEVMSETLGNKKKRIE
ncbi:ABC transporter ATP-binding protein [Paenibacillus marinisediminis]